MADFFYFFLSVCFVFLKRNWSYFSSLGMLGSMINLVIGLSRLYHHESQSAGSQRVIYVMDITESHKRPL